MCFQKYALRIGLPLSKAATPRGQCAIAGPLATELKHMLH